MTVLIAGCGDLGTQAGLQFAAQGHRVIGLRRSPERLPDPIEGCAVDLTREPPTVPDDTDVVVFVTSADNRSAGAYQDAYVTALRTVLGAVERSSADPRILLVSSTAVLGVSDGRWVDESTPVEANTGTAEVLIEAERVLRERAPRATILRLAGIYGPGRGSLLRRVRAGDVALPSRSPVYTNRIHRDDAVAAIVHLTTAVDRAEPVYTGADGHPVDRGELLCFLADEMGVAHPPTANEDTAGGHGKRCRNRLLRDSGFSFQYPTYRDGYRALLSASGRDGRGPG